MLMPVQTGPIEGRLESSRRGFTLVELLVVIGIIALLISILLPALNRARASAQKVVCMTHLHDLGQALQLYVNDNKGTGYFGYNIYGPVPAPHIGTTFNEYWFGAYYNDPVWDYNAGYMTRYLVKNPLIVLCPEVGDKTNTSSNSSIVPISYGYNSAPTFQTFKRITQVIKPSDTFALADTASVATSGTGNSLGAVYSAFACSKTSSKNPNFIGRHGGLGNVLWYDGHVTSERPYICNQASSYSTAAQPYISSYVTAKIGYLTPISPSEYPESTLVFNSTPANGNPVNLDYYYWLNKRAQK